MGEEGGKHHSAVPFLWEEKPGTPKKDWKPQSLASQPKPLPVPPRPPWANLIASVPFKWEERPGKPLPSDASPHQEPGFLTPSTYQGLDGILGLNRVASSAAQRGEDRGGQSGSEAPSSPASEGNGSFVGASFLEWLFPMVPPAGSGVLQNQVSSPNNGSPVALAVPELKQKEDANVGIRKESLTLGELILMSRRRSLHGRASRIQDHPSNTNSGQDYAKRKSFSCCIFGSECDW